MQWVLHVNHDSVEIDFEPKSGNFYVRILDDTGQLHHNNHDYPHSSFSLSPAEGQFYSKAFPVETFHFVTAARALLQGNSEKPRAVVRRGILRSSDRTGAVQEDALFYRIPGLTASDFNHIKRQMLRALETLRTDEIVRAALIGELSEFRDSFLVALQKAPFLHKIFFDNISQGLSAPTLPRTATIDGSLTLGEISYNGDTVKMYFDRYLESCCVSILDEFNHLHHNSHIYRYPKFSFHPEEAWFHYKTFTEQGRHVLGWKSKTHQVTRAGILLQPCDPKHGVIQEAVFFPVPGLTPSDFNDKKKQMLHAMEVLPREEIIRRALAEELEKVAAAFSRSFSLSPGLLNLFLDLPEGLSAPTVQRFVPLASPGLK